MPRTSTTAHDLALLFLRSAGLLLCLTFGTMKLLGWIARIVAGGPILFTGLAPLIHRAGFPLAGPLAVYATLCESVVALFVACGFCTRTAALALVLSMGGAFYVSMWLQEEPLRAALYLTIFAGLALSGPGRFSVDHWLRSRSSHPGSGAGA